METLPESYEKVTLEYIPGDEVLLRLLDGDELVVKGLARPMGGDVFVRMSPTNGYLVSEIAMPRQSYAEAYWEPYNIGIHDLTMSQVFLLDGDYTEELEETPSGTRVRYLRDEDVGEYDLAYITNVYEHKQSKEKLYTLSGDTRYFIREELTKI